MSFYTSISDYYRMMFPLNPKQIQFVKDRISNPQEMSLLDIGCGTGDLSLELATSFEKVVGIDLDSAMLNAARKEAKKIKNIKFHQLNMMDIKSRFGPDAFDAILCFGNTLVHLENTSAILDFFMQINSILKEGGKFLLQIINYDRILDHNIDSLPTLDNNHINFVRNYHYWKDRHLIEFETILTIKSTNQVILNNIPLFPIRQSEIEKLLFQAGFKTIQFFGDFMGDPLLPESIPMIIETSA